jgi:hypothetical protein
MRANGCSLEIQGLDAIGGFKFDLLAQHGEATPNNHLLHIHNCLSAILQKVIAIAIWSGRFFFPSPSVPFPDLAFACSDLLLCYGQAWS